MEHVRSGHALESCVYICADISERVPYVEPCTTWVGEHVEHVDGATIFKGLEAIPERAGWVRRPEGVLTIPTVLPLGLN